MLYDIALKIEQIKVMLFYHFQESKILMAKTNNNNLLDSLD
jgi:hypothetical protein